MPVWVVTDGGTEFDDVVQQGFDDDCSFVDKPVACSPHQNGLIERHETKHRNLGPGSSAAAIG